MTPLDALQARRSVPPRMVRDPGPDETELRTILAAGTRAADHGRLRPWRFLVVRGDSRKRLADAFVNSRLRRDATAGETVLVQERARAERVPVTIVVVSRPIQNHPIPLREQLLSAGAAAQGILSAAYAQGFGAMWVTGGAAYDAQVHRDLGLEDKDEIVGFIGIGSVDAAPTADPAADLEKVVLTLF